MKKQLFYFCKVGNVKERKEFKMPTTVAKIAEKEREEGFLYWDSKRCKESDNLTSILNKKKTEIKRLHRDKILLEIDLEWRE